MAKAEAIGRGGIDAPFVIRPKREEVWREGSQDSSEAVEFVVTEREQESAPRASARRVIDPESATVNVEQPLPRGNRKCSICGEIGHTARTCQAEGAAGIATRAPRKPSPTAVGAIAPMLVGTANFCVVTTFGSECGLTDMEGRILIPSMQRTLERMPAGAAARMSYVIDPLVILTVCIMWAKRIAQTKDREAREKYQVKPTEAARAAGVSGFTYSVPQTQPEPAPQSSANPISPNGATNGVYGATEEIRSAFTSDAEF